MNWKIDKLSDTIASTQSPLNVRLSSWRGPLPSCSTDREPDFRSRFVLKSRYLLASRLIRCDWQARWHVLVKFSHTVIDSRGSDQFDLKLKRREKTKQNYRINFEPRRLIPFHFQPSKTMEKSFYTSFSSSFPSIILRASRGGWLRQRERDFVSPRADFFYLLTKPP